MKKETFCIVDIESRSRTPIDRGPANYFADSDAGLICRRGRVVKKPKWILDRNDNVKAMRRMTDGSVDLTVTSPPYDNLRTYEGYSFDFENVARELYRITKPGGVVVWIVGDATVKGSETGTSFRQALFFKEIGFNLHDTMIWNKPNPMPRTHPRYEQGFEFMFIFSKGAPSKVNLIKESTKNAGKKRTGTFRHDGETLRQKHKSGFYSSEKIKTNVWSFSGEGVKGHPAPFPLKLATDHILSWSNPGDLVFDPFAGSGTTLVAALQNGRNAYGVEISSKYCEMIKARLVREVK